MLARDDFGLSFLQFGQRVCKSAAVFRNSRLTAGPHGCPPAAMLAWHDLDEIGILISKCYE